MKALVKSKAEPGLWMEEIDRPQVGDNDVLIRVKKSAICGTDAHIYQWDEWSQHYVTIPIVLGHEFMGVVAEYGASVKGVAEGERVIAEGHVTCGHCRHCKTGRRHLCPETVGIGLGRNGGFAEYVSVPQENIFKLPDNISDDIGALLDPLGNATHTALSFDLLGEDILITGAGPIGMMAAAVCRHAGARHIVITDINDYRLKMATRMGASLTVNVERKPVQDVIGELNLECGFTVALEMSGSPLALTSIFDVICPGGKIALLGILPEEVGINLDMVIFKNLTIQGIYGRKIFDTHYKMVYMLQSGLDITSIITHQLPADKYQEGFEAMISGNSGKVILDWES